MLPVNSGGHTAYQTFVKESLRKYYPDPTVSAKSTWDIIGRFWNLDLSYTDELLRSKYSVFGLKPRTPSCMQRSYLLSLDFKVHPPYRLGCSIEDKSSLCNPQWLPFWLYSRSRYFLRLPWQTLGF